MADAKKTPTQELQIYRSNDLAALEELKTVLLGGDFNVEVIDDPALISRQILSEIFSAETVDELERRPAEGWRDYMGRPMEIHSFTARKSDFEGSDLYFVIRATDMTDGEDKILTTGSLNVCGQLIKLATMGEIPGCIRILCEDTTKSNNPVYYLASTPEELRQRRDARVAARKESAE